MIKENIPEYSVTELSSALSQLLKIILAM